MKFPAWSITVAVFLIAGMVSVLAKQKATPTPAVAKIVHGKYLVESVAMCVDCHSPRDDKGEPIPGKVLKGSVLIFKPIAPMPVWADQAPNIAGLAGWEDDAAVKFLMTGLTSNNLRGRPPMPQYRFNREDAEAVVAYLKSLSTADK